MNRTSNLVKSIVLGSSVAFAITAGVWWSVPAQAHKEPHSSHHGQHALHMTQIKTQAEAEALKPGDSIAMVCSKCKHVMVQQVTNHKSHVKLMTIGQKHTCAVCKGAVEVVGIGNGKGKNKQVNYVCSKCGDDAMFVCATKPGSGKKHQHSHNKK